jgi:hypothetical protein
MSLWDINLYWSTWFRKTRRFPGVKPKRISKCNFIHVMWRKVRHGANHTLIYKFAINVSEQQTKTTIPRPKSYPWRLQFIYRFNFRICGHRQEVFRMLPKYLQLPLLSTTLLWSETSKEPIKCQYYLQTDFKLSETSIVFPRMFQVFALMNETKNEHRILVG